MKIFIGTDHKGIEVEKELINYLESKNISVSSSLLKHSDTDDYVDFAEDVCKKVLENTDSFGILICGTGIGMSIAANKIKGIRAARCTSVDDSYLTRCDNDSNVLCLSHKQDLSLLKEIVDKFINTPFSNLERHQRRIDKIKKLEGNINED